MNQKNRLFHCIQISIFSLTLLFTSACAGNLSGGDNFLFGLSEAFDRVFGDEEVVACSTDVTVTTKVVSLVEDGDVNSTFSTSSDNGLTDDDTNGGTSWGYRSFQTCVYPNSTFAGTVEIPLTLTSNYGARITSTKSFPAPSVAIPTSLTFTSHGQSERQCFTFTAEQDADRNTVVSPMILALGTMVQKNGSGQVVSGTYSGKDACDITVSVEDDEGTGIRVSNISNIMEEPGVSSPNSGTFSVVLRTLPTADVTIGINDTYDSINSNNREGNATPTSITFTTANWDTPRIVTVNSNDDLEVDGLKIYTIRTNPATSSDADYNGLKPRDVVIYNKDQSVPGYAYERFNSTTGTTAQAGGTITGFATDESNRMGSTYANYKLKLRSKPTSDVTLNLSSNCGTKCQILTPSLTFTTSNWNTYQNIQVEGRSDSANSGNQDYNVTFTVTSSDTTYSTTVAKPIFQIRSCDNDSANLIQTCNFSGSPLGTTGSRLTGAEPGASTHIWLITQNSPASTVTVPLSSSDTTEGTVPADVQIDSNNFNKLDISASNQVVLTHVDDTIVDGVLSGGNRYEDWTVVTGLSTGSIAFNPIDIFARTQDNEEYFYVKVTGSTTEGTANTATVDVCLGSNNPNNIVSLTLLCTSGHDECGTISVAQIDFPINSQVSLANASDANCSNDGNRRSFTVTGADDTWADGTQTFTVTLTKSTTEPNYAAAPTTITTPNISNADNEPAGKRVFVTASSFNGEMTAQGVLGADSNCNSNKPSGVTGTYKALIVSDSGGEVNDRTTGSGWPISPNLHYYRCNSSGYTNCSDEHQRLFIANVSGTFNPIAMGSLRDFTDTLSDEFWTGMTNTLAPATQGLNPTSGACGVTYRQNCHGFTYRDCPLNPNPVLYGQFWKNNGSGSITSSDSVCTASKKLICVEQ